MWNGFKLKDVTLEFSDEFLKVYNEMKPCFRERADDYLKNKYSDYEKFYDKYIKNKLAPWPASKLY